MATLEPEAHTVCGFIERKLCSLLQMQTVAVGLHLCKVRIGPGPMVTILQMLFFSSQCRRDSRALHNIT